MEWDEKRQLKLNPDFQRGPVWPVTARTFLVDSILRQLPIPKIYLRTRVDLETKRSFREVVDGQQRLRAILDFGNNKFALGSRANEYATKRYDDLTPEEKERFLGYTISVDQLINASDADVLEVFSRLNSYTVPVNPAELRHAKYQGEFKWAVHDKARQWSTLWEDYKVVGTRQAVRLLSDSLMAEMYGVLLEGVRDGGQPKINSLYERHDESYTRGKIDDKIDLVLEWILHSYRDALMQTPISSAPHFLMLFAATAHVFWGIPEGDLESLPARGKAADSDVSLALLSQIGEVLGSDDPPRGAVPFWSASASSTQRIASRRVRFPVYVRAIQGESLGW